MLPAPTFLPIPSHRLVAATVARTTRSYDVRRYRIVEAHGGEMTVESAVNVGTAFSFTLPLA